MVAPLDVADAACTDAAMTAAEQRFNGIDVLVNNVGYGYTAAVEEGEDEAVARLFATDFFGPAAMIKAALPGMRYGAKGLIVNISSVGAHHHPRRRLLLRRRGPGGLSGVSLHGGQAAGAARHGRRTMIVPHPLPRRSADRSRVRIDAYEQVLGRTGISALGPQHGAPDKAATAMQAATAERS